jgi:AcrR family transcriptional regulator
MDGQNGGNDPEGRPRPDLREAILRASLELGTELGEEGLTMRAIAARLGVSATALYQHFDGKAAILRAIRVYGGEMLTRHLLPAHELADPVARLTEQSLRYVGFARENPWLYRLLFQEEEIDWTRVSPEEAEAMAVTQRKTVKCFVDGIASGQFRADIDIATAPFLLWAANHGLATLILGGRISETHPAFPVKDQQAFVQAFVRSVLRGFEP